MELHYTRTSQWHSWLLKNHLKEKEVWLVYYKKPSGKPRIPYGEAVEEALCFGWIDGKIRSINEDYYIQRFTPRRRDSSWSQLNISRVEKLISEGRMQKAGLDAYQVYLDNPAKTGERKMTVSEMPEELKLALQGRENAWENFMRFPDSARRIYIRWLMAAKRPETIARRIIKIADLAEKNIKSTML
jgi:uncharacterized protein YdeI (YjbR/CyaY-like superfamily)